jgi:tRNA(Ile)-lysidine synthase
MIRMLTKLPRDITVAFSGGVDSVAAVDFLRRNHTVTCAFFHHRTENSTKAHQFVTEFCEERNLSLVVGILNKDKPKDKSMEEHWRDERYKFFDNFQTVVTAHHLDDCIETYLFTAMHGNPKLIPMNRGNVVRPFLTTPKSEFFNWCLRKDLPFCYDKSNDDDKYMRNYIRKHVVPHAYKVNPGIDKVVKKMVQDACKSTQKSVDVHVVKGQV